MDVDAILARQPERGAGRRARAHQRPGLAQREALAGRRRAARRRHRRDLHRQRAAPRVDERRGRGDHRDQAAGDDPRRGRAGGRPDRARRHDARRRCGAGWRTATSTRRRRSTPRSPTTSGRATSARCASSRCMWVADRVDEALEEYREAHGIARPWETRERVVVAITGAPGGDDVIRRAARMAARAARRAARRPRAAGRRARAAPPATRSTSSAGSCRSSAASTTSSRAPTSPATLVQFARAENATQIVLGASRQSRWTHLLRGSVINNVLRASGDDRRPRDLAPKPTTRRAEREHGRARVVARVGSVVSPRRRMLAWIARRPGAAAADPASSPTSATTLDAAERPAAVPPGRRGGRRARRLRPRVRLRDHRLPARQLVLHAAALRVHDRGGGEPPRAGDLPRRRRGR